MALTTMKRALSCGALILFLYACTDGTPEVLESHQLANPSGTMVATVEYVGNGLGFGANALYDEIHISPPNSPSFRHGDSDPTVAFYALADNDKDHPPKIKWVSDSLLHVTLDPLSKPGLQKFSVNGISIEYVVQGTKRNTP